MKALIYEGPKKVAVREVEKPVPKEGQALIRMTTAVSAALTLASIAAPIPGPRPLSS